MSLVAYASSGGEDSASDNESEETATSSTSVKEQCAKPPVPSTATSDELTGADLIEDDEYDVVPASDNMGLSLPAPKHTAGPSSQDVMQSTEPEDDLSSVLRGLPTPKPHKKNVFANDVEDELEEEVKPKMKQLKDAPTLPVVKKKQKLKISAPVLDSDSDEEVPAKKKKKIASSSKSGLFGLLPQPKNTVVKEVGRQLIPHRVTTKSKAAPKRPPSQPSPATKVPHSLVAAADDDDDDSDDDNAGSFFSLDAAQQKNTSVHQSAPAAKEDASTPSLRGPWLNPMSAAQGLLGPARPTTAPVSKPAHAAPTTVSSVHLQPAAYQSDVYEPAELPASDVAGPSHDAQMTGPDLSTEEFSTAQENAYPETDDVNSYLQDEEFLKMMGKRKSGKQEEINFIDVHGNNQMSEVDLMKHMTEEKEQRGSKNKDMPTSRQRNKHQITYLAFQAKERELELKNQWAQNRTTKRQTQSKYGF